MWKKIDDLCHAAFGMGHAEKYSGSPASYEIFNECLLKLVASGTLWTHWELVKATGDAIRNF